MNRLVEVFYQHENRAHIDVEALSLELRLAQPSLKWQVPDSVHQSSVYSCRLMDHESFSFGCSEALELSVD